MSSNNQMPPLTIGPYTAQIPVVQGGMGVGISLSGLAAAVAQAGGIGVISSVGLGMLDSHGSRHTREANRQRLVQEIQRARSQTNGIIGCNIMVALSDYQEMVDTALDEEVDLLFLGAGLPLKFSSRVTPDRIKSGPTRFVPIVSSGRALNVIFNFWDRKYGTVPDAVVVEGPLAGGHLGFKKGQINDPDFTLENLLPDVVESAQPFEQKYGRAIPVIAAGGVFSGADIRAMLNLGARGVQMGTRFVATHECDADIRFKKAFVTAEKKDTILIQSPVGLPGRAIENAFLRSVASGNKKPVRCPWKCLKTCDIHDAPYCIAQALINAQTGRIDQGFVFAGANAWRVNEIVSVEELFRSLKAEYRMSVEEKILAA